MMSFRPSCMPPRMRGTASSAPIEVMSNLIYTLCALCMLHVLDLSSGHALAILMHAGSSMVIGDAPQLVMMKSLDYSKIADNAG